MIRWFSVLAIACAVLMPDRCLAQNVSNYGNIPEPFLFLLREPIVHQDLGLSSEQRAQLAKLNEQFDGDLLRSRNVPAAESQPIVAKVMSASREAVAEIFTKEQQDRIRQITYQLRGISFVLIPEAADRLNLSTEDKERIERICDKARDRLNELQSQVYNGQMSRQEAEQTARQVRIDEQKRVLEKLNHGQRTRLRAMIGRQFDVTGLGEVSFKAPELSATGVWMNTHALQLAQLRGQVVALHFWAFG